MDSDPEPRSNPSSESTTPVTGAQADEPAEEPPSPFQSTAFVLGPLIAALTLMVPFSSVVADRFVSAPGPRIDPGGDLMGVSPQPSFSAPQRPSSHPLPAGRP